MSRHVPSVHVLGCSLYVVYADEAVASKAKIANSMRSKLGAVVRTLRRRSHYLYEKLLTPRYERTVAGVLRNQAYGTVVSSYLCTTPLLERYVDEASVLGLVETHNDDFKWFDDIAGGTSNPLVRRAAIDSIKWTESYFRRVSRKYVFLHVTPGDRQGYAAYDPEHASLIAPVGVSVDGYRTVEHREDGRIRLLFVGSLSTNMNYDALAYFGDHIYPAVSKDFGEQLEITVAGSNPTRRVRSLCHGMGWTLEANVSDERLQELYQAATFSILPFKYATGAKLKVLESLSYGVPFLGTTRVDVQLDEVRPPCFLSDDPSEWSGHLRRIANNGITFAQREGLINLAQSQSWTRIAERLHTDLIKISL